MGVQYSFCKSFLEKSAFSDPLPPEKWPMTETRTKFLFDSCLKEHRFSGVLKKWLQVTCDVWLTAFEYVTGWVTASALLSMKVGTEDRKLLRLSDQ